MLDKYINCNYNPSNIFDFPWLYYFNEKYDEEDYGGKWLLFFDKGKKLDDNWNKIQKLYDKGELYGVHSLQVSTNYKNTRVFDDKYGVIVIHCGPINNKERLLEIGNNIIKKIEYSNDCGYIYYKSNLQTLNGSRGTGSCNNWIYRLKIEFDYSFIN